MYLFMHKSNKWVERTKTFSLGNVDFGWETNEFVEEDMALSGAKIKNVDIETAIWLINLY